MIRFQADADFDARIVRAIWRMEPELDLQDAQAVDLVGVPDLQVLEIAASENRMLLTHDKRTMPAHFATFLRQGSSSPGVLIVSQGIPVGAAARGIVRIWQREDAADRVDRLAWLRPTDLL